MTPRTMSRDDIPIFFETDESGEVTAYNDDLRIMAIGPDEETAAAKFRDALAALDTVVHSST